MSALTASPRTYRLQCWYLLLGLAGLVEFSTFGILAFTDSPSPPYSITQSVLLASIFSGFVLLSLWTLAAYFRERLTVTGSTLVQRRVIGSTAFELAEVTRAKWHCCPGAVSVLLSTHSRRIKIHFSNFTAAERAELVALLRESIAPGVQQGWEHRLAPSGQPEIARQRARSAWAPLPLVILLATLSSLCLYAWISYGIGLQWAAVGVVLGLASLCYLWRMWRLSRQTRQPN